MSHIPARHFTPFPILTSARLQLRQLTTGDAEAVFALRSSIDVNKYLGRQPAKSIEDAVNFIESVNGNIAKNAALYWAIVLENKVAGTICLYSFSDESNSCEIGYELLPEYQRKGIMREAAAIVIKYAFESLGIETINAWFHRDNLESTKLLEKFSFADSGEVDNSNTDLINYQLANSQFQEK